MTELLYDGAGNLAEIRETGGTASRSTKYDYDINGNLTSITDALGQTQSYTYDTLNRLTEEVSAAGRRESYGYDGAGHLTSITDALGSVTRLAYDGNGNLITLSDGEGRSISYTYDPADQLIKAIEGSVSLGENMVLQTSSVTSYTYDTVGNLLSVTDGNGNQTSYTYDLAGRLTSRTNALGEKESYVYDLGDCLTAFTRGDGSTISYDYDKLDELVSIDYGKEEEAHNVLYTYDSEGRRLSMEDLTGTSTYTYDEAGRLATVTDGNGNTVAYAYDGFSNLSELTYPDGSKVSYTYDALDRLIKVTDRKGNTTSYTYDEDSLLTGVERPNGTKTHLTYDAAGQIVSLVNTDGQGKEVSSYHYTYDVAGFIIQEESTQTIEGKPCSITSSYTYDERGELLTVSTLQDGKLSELRYAYDGAGNRIRVERSEDTVRTYLAENTFDEVNRLIKAETTDGTVTYTYDKNGNRTGEVRGDEQIVYTYDVENRLEAVMEGERLLMAALYDGDGNRVFQMEYGENIPKWERDDRDSYETEEREEHSKSWEERIEYSILKPWFDRDTTETEEIEETKNDIFWYGFGQGTLQGLTSVPGYLSRWLHEHWQYLLQRIELHKNYEVSSGSDREDEVLKPRKGDSYTNVLYDEIFIPYQVGEAARESYLKTSYVNDVNRSYVQVLMEYGIEETKSEGITTRSKQEISAVYEYGLQRLSYEDAIGGEDFTYTYDGRGSTVNLTSQRGLSVISYVYDAYGTASAYSSAGGMAGGSIGARTGTGAGTDAEEEAELLPGGRNPYLYNGEAVDRATGFQYLRSRYYSSNTGSFLTQDTYGGSLRDPLSQNLYTYTGNDPVNLQDPSGHGWLSKAVSKVKSTVSKVTSAVKTAVQKVSSAAKKVVNTVKSTVKKTVTKAVVKTGVSAVSKAVKSQTTSSGKLQSKSKSSSKSQGKSQTSKGGTLSSRSTGGSVQTAASKASKNYGQQVSQVARKSNSPAPLNWKQKLAKSMGGSANNVRQVTTGHAYVNNKLLTATSENERKMCQKGATLTSAGLALEPSALEGISQTLMQMLAAAGTMMGTVVTGPEMLAGVAVGAGVYWTYQEWQKVGPIALVSSPASKLAANWKASQASSSVASTTFDILNEQIKELRKKKEEQETIHVGPGDENYEVVDTDGKVVYKGGGSGGNKKNDDDDDDLTPVAPENGNWNSNSESAINSEQNEIQNKLDELLHKSLYKEVDGIDCSEIAEDFYNAAGQKGEILRFEGKGELIQIGEYGKIKGYLYHVVYTDGESIYDPRYSETAIPIDEYFRLLDEWNPNGYDMYYALGGD